jgi:hypothetical protein
LLATGTAIQQIDNEKFATIAQARKLDSALSLPLFD